MIDIMQRIKSQFRIQRISLNNLAMRTNSLLERKKKREANRTGPRRIKTLTSGSRAQEIPKKADSKTTVGKEGTQDMTFLLDSDQKTERGDQTRRER